MEYLEENWWNEGMKQMLFPDITGYVNGGFTWELTDSGFSAVFKLNDSIKTKGKLILPEEANDISLTLKGDAEFDIFLDTIIDLAFKVNSETGKFSFDINQFKFQTQILTNDLLLQGLIGALEVDIGKEGENFEKGYLDLKLGGNIVLKNGMFDFTPLNNSIDAILPVYAELNGVPIGSREFETLPRVYVTGTLFRDNGDLALISQVSSKDFALICNQNEEIFLALIENGYIDMNGVIQDKFWNSTFEDFSISSQFTGLKSEIYNILKTTPDFRTENFKEFLDFSNFEITDFESMLQNILSWINEYTDYDLMNNKIPFVNKSLNELIDYS